MSTAADELSALDADTAAKHDTWVSARERLRAAQDISAEFAAPIREVRDQLLYRQIDENPEKAQRRVTLQLVDQIVNEGLLLVPGNGGPASLSIVDPGLEAREREAAAALAEANRKRVRFEEQHAAEIQAEKDKAEAEKIRTVVLQSDDPAAIRKVLVEPSETPSFTTADLP